LKMELKERRRMEKRNGFDVVAEIDVLVSKLPKSMLIKPLK